MLSFEGIAGKRTGRFFGLDAFNFNLKFTFS